MIRLKILCAYERPDCQEYQVDSGSVFCVSDTTIDGFTTETDDTFFD